MTCHSSVCGVASPIPSFACVVGTLNFLICSSIMVCVCVCVRKRVSVREREGESVCVLWSTCLVSKSFENYTEKKSNLRRERESLCVCAAVTQLLVSKSFGSYT